MALQALKQRGQHRRVAQLARLQGTKKEKAPLATETATVSDGTAGTQAAWAAPPRGPARTPAGDEKRKGSASNRDCNRL